MAIKKEKPAEDMTFLNDMANAGGLTGALNEELKIHITALQDALQTVALCEEQLDAAKEILRKLQEEVIPNALQGAGLSELRMVDTGLVVFIKEDIKCAIPKDDIKRNKCMEWLKKQGAEDIIKSEVIIPEINNQVINDDLLDKLAGLGIYYENDRAVNTNTLKAWFREKLGMKKGTYQTIEPDSVPKEFSLYHYRKAEIR